MAKVEQKEIRRFPVKRKVKMTIYLTEDNYEFLQSERVRTGMNLTEMLNFLVDAMREDSQEEDK